MEPGTLVQVYVPGAMGRIGKVTGQEKGKLLVLIDGETYRVPPEKALVVRTKPKRRRAAAPRYVESHRVAGHGQEGEDFVPGQLGLPLGKARGEGA